MPLPTQSLAAIQAAGAAIFAADVELKTSARDYAGKVKTAMLDNPFDMGNDSLFEDWKTVARLSLAIAQVEAEFRRIYAAASDLSAGARSPVLGMPSLMALQIAAGSDLTMVQEVDATDAVIKKTPTKKAKKLLPRKVTASKSLRGNTAKILAGMLEILNPTDFLKINRSAIAAKLGVPKGSIGASISKLIETGHLIEGDSGSFKLGTPKSQG